MEDLPEELRTPPVALAALVGMPELHPQISMSLHTEQPPINTLALPDFSKVAVIGGKEGAPLEARIPAPAGVLKADWMHKHRTKVPAVLAVLFDREQVNGDPAQWMEVCSHLDNVRNVIRGRNTKLVVAIVQPTLHGEINDDRTAALRKRAELDNKCCMTFISHDPTELKRSLARLGSILGELANLYYKEQSRRVKARLDKKNWTATEIAVRFNFKMGYYAEFRRDWVTALRFYETAYTLLLETLQIAASYMAGRRRTFERAFATFESFDNPDAVDVLAGPPEEVGPPLYVGQGPRVLSRMSEEQSATPDEYMRHAMLTERQFPHSRAAINLLTKAHEQYKATQATRMIYYLGTQMGREYFHAGEHENAKRLFDTVAEMYRKEAWVELLAASLEYLRETAKHLGLSKEFLEYSLELAALPEESWSEVARRSTALTDVIAAITGTDALPDGEAPIALEIDLVSPLRGVLSVCVAFHEQAVKPGMSTRLTVSLLTHLPHPLELDDLEIHFNQNACNLALKHSLDQGHDLKLMPHQWKRLEVDIIAVKSGKLECLFAVARLGRNTTVRCQVESPASREPDPFWQFEPALESYPVKDKNLAFLGQKVVQVEEVEPKVDIEIDSGGTGLLGETVLVRIHIRSRGHAIDAGELQVSVTEVASNDAFSPKTPSTGSSAACAKIFVPARLKDGSGETLLWEFQGSMKIPYVEADGSWSTSTYLRFTEAKPVSFFVTLGYQIQFGTNDDTHKLWSHKHVDLQCEEALRINCRYMVPFQRDAFLPGSVERSAGTVLPFDESSTMVLTARNICSVPLLISPVQVEEKNARTCQVRRMEGSRLRNSAISQSSEGTKLLPGEVFNQILSIRPLAVSSSLDIGTVALRWEREQQRQEPEVVEVSGIDEIMASPSSTDATGILQSSVTTRLALPVIAVEKAPVVVSLQYPPYGLLGTPFTLSFRIQNR
ncbi:trafficking protein particle complex subunit 11, partial [Selaginella moellendorffii]|uniref:trafficking protein particle complex subunit 11 n=1 Tax=Selaginella moellendorffii TaxID=88036 RepID=UPI000D1C6B26